MNRMECQPVIWHYTNTLYSGLSKSNFKDHYGDTTKGQYLGRIAEMNVF